MALVLGPILSFRGASEGRWRVSALVVTGSGDRQPTLSATFGGKALEAPVTDLGRYPEASPAIRAWRFDLAVPLGDKPGRVDYSVDGGERLAFDVPARGAIPQSAYVSCNGFSSLKLLNKTADPHALWGKLRERHAEAPFHLLMMGGDQIYADAMWDTLPELREWAALPLKARTRRSYTQAMEKRVERFYAELYPNGWSQPEVAAMLARIPTIMMWDDHEIFDGWGSHRAELQGCAVFKGIFASARRYFALYQQQLRLDERHPCAIPGQGQFSLGFDLGPLAILALDMRSERTADRVIGFDSWKAIYEWLEALPGKGQGPAHVFALTSIPVIYPDFGLIEEALGALPGDQELEDDLRDHWNSQPHKEERLRFIHRILAFTRAKRTRVTLLSGDVHVAAVGIVRSTSTDSDPRCSLFNQLTSSGIVHPPPPGVVLFFLEKVMTKQTEEDRDIHSEMTAFPGTRYYYIGSRNWLSLEGDEEHRIWAHWNVEGARHPLTKVIHPIDFRMPAPTVPAAHEVRIPVAEGAE